MNLVCYAYKNRDGELRSPFMDYLQKYVVSEHDSLKKKTVRTKQIFSIHEHLEHLKENEGRYNIPPYCQQYHGHHIGILKISENSNLVRVAFYTKSGDAIVVLDAIEKPKLYEKGKKLQIDKAIKKFLVRAEQYKADYEISHLSIPLNIYPTI